MKILITGGAGFIGSNFVLYMLEKYDYEVIVLDSLTYAGNIYNLESVKDHPKLKFVHLDICDHRALDHLFKSENFDYVVNFAAESHVDRSISDPNIFLKTNILGCANLLQLSLKYQVKRFHQVSTDEVYGDLALDRVDLLFKEDNLLKPSSPYSASKASADLLVLAYHRTFGLDVTISRCSNNYGPYQFPEKLIPLMIYKAKHHQNLPVYGTGLNVRDWLHVSDHCRAIDLILHQAKSGSVYNVGGNCERNNLTIVKNILKILDLDEGLITFVSDRLGHDLRYAIDASKIKNDLNWQPSINFEQGLKDTVNWYLNNEEWLQGIIDGSYQNIKKLEDLKNV